jgi:hypothetical protein
MHIDTIHMSANVHTHTGQLIKSIKGLKAEVRLWHMYLKHFSQQAVNQYWWPMPRANYICPD